MSQLPLWNSSTTIVDLILFVVQVVTLVALVVYVWKTWEMASATRRSADIAVKTLQEIRDSRDQETAPYVIVYFDIPFGESMIYLAVKNIGRTAASKVRLAFEPPLQNSYGHDVGNIGFIKDEIPSLPPGYEMRTFFDASSQYIDKDHLPQRYTARVSYCGGMNPGERTGEFVLDLGVYKDRQYIHLKGLHDLVGRVDDVAKHQARAARELGRIAESLRSDAGTILTGEPAATSDASDLAEGHAPQDLGGVAVRQPGQQFPLSTILGRALARLRDALG